MWILAGDIGGTNTRLALVDAENPRSPRRLRLYRSADHGSLEAIAADYLDRCRREGEPPPTRAGFGIAGPVDGAIVALTNMPWVVDKARLAAALGLERVEFVNDFAATVNGKAGKGIEVWLRDFGQEAKVEFTATAVGLHPIYGSWGHGSRIGMIIVRSK